MHARMRVNEKDKVQRNRSHFQPLSVSELSESIPLLLAAQHLFLLH